MDVSENQVEEYLASSQAFVRALKGSADAPNGLTKLTIAKACWERKDVIVPMKQELTTEWILTEMLKDRNLSPLTSTVVQPEYWDLLSKMISGEQGSTIKDWLRLFVARTPIYHIFTSFFLLLSQVEEHSRTSLERCFESCFQILWPMACNRGSSEQLLECFGATCAALGDPTAIFGTLMLDVVRQICTAYHKSLPAASNRKKLAATFMSLHWASWLNSVQVLDHAHPTLNVIRSAGVETIFYPEVVKTASEGTLDPLFIKTLSTWVASSPDLYYWAAPRILDSFALISRRTRGIASLSASKANAHSSQGRVAVLHLYILLDDLLEPQSRSTEAWNAHTDMLRCLQNNRTLSMRDTILTSRLAHHAAVIMNLLDTSDLQSALQDALLNCLNVISSMDIEAVITHTPKIFDALLSCDAHSIQTTSLLDAILDYYAKTRSIPTYVLHLLDSVSSLVERAPGDWYHSACRSPLFAVQHSEHIQQVVATFITSTQVVDYADLVVDRLQRQLSVFISSTNEPGSGDARSGKTRKKRKLNPEQSSRCNAVATTCALTARIASMVLMSLPIGLLDATAQSQAQQSLTGKARELIERSMRSMSEVSGASSNTTWAWTIVGAEVVRLHYSLSASWGNWTYSLADDKTRDLFSKLVETQVIPPGLSLLLYRTNLTDITAGPESVHLLEGLLKSIMQKHQSLSSWSGRLDDMYHPGTTASTEAAALLQLVLVRCLRAVQVSQVDYVHEALAEMLLSAICTVTSKNDTGDGVSARNIVLAALHRAELWESSAMCNSLLKKADERTNVLDDLERTSKLDVKAPDDLSITQTVNIFEFLLAAPPDITNHAFMSKMILRALHLDSYMSIDSDLSHTRSHIILRSFIARTCNSPQALVPSTIDSMIFNMINALSTQHRQHPQLVGISTFILKHSLHVYLRTKDQSNLVDSQLQHLIESLNSVNRQEAHEGVAMVATCVLEAGIAAGRSQMIADTQIRTALDTICNQLTSLCSTSIPLLLASHTSTPSVVRIYVKAYQVSLHFQRTHSMVLSNQVLTQNLVARLVNNSATTGINQDVTFSLLVEHWRSSGTEDNSTFETVLAMYLKLSKGTTQSTSPLAKLWQETVRTLSVDTFRHALILLHEFVEQPGPIYENLAVALSVADQTLQHAPDGSTKITQELINLYLLTFVNHGSIWTNRPATRMAALNLLLNYCSTRPASLRPVDVGNTLVYLSQIMAPSSTHDEYTAKAIFHGVSSLLSSFIHTRRDLVSHVLPHVGLLLSRLMLCFRQSRPQLGGGQARKIHDTFPSWLAPSDPLGINEAHALSRLLGSFTVKTVLRTFASQGNGAEGAPASLARAFGKHTITVLKAYVDALNDPLSTVPADVRKELQPGMFAMCGMISEHNRDALMVSSLDSSGKYIMKALWKDYEKQRYIGRG